MVGPINRVEGGTITNAKGFKAGGTYVGIKTFSEDKMDMGPVSYTHLTLPTILLV